MDRINDLNTSLHFNKQMLKVLCEEGKGEISNQIKYIMAQLNGETDMLHKRIERLNKEKQDLREEINLLHKMEEKHQFHELELIREH